MPTKKQPLESKIEAAMAAVRGTKADPERRPDADEALSDLHEYASTQEYPGKEAILPGVEQAVDSFQADNYTSAVQHLSRALIRVTRI